MKNALKKTRVRGLHDGKNSTIAWSLVLTLVTDRQTDRHYTHGYYAKHSYVMLQLIKTCPCRYQRQKITATLAEFLMMRRLAIGN